MDTIKKDAETRMKKSVKSLQDDFNGIRTGRASTSLLDRINADYYGTPTPLSQIANISIPEARLIVIQPFDKNALSDIEKAIQSSDLGLNPSNDGKVIRLIIPPLTEERRKDLAKQARNIAEQAKVAVRNIRRDINDLIKKGDFTEDEKKKGSDDIQKLTDSYILEIGKISDGKEKEIMEI